MSIRTKDGLTDLEAAHFFAAPESASQRQYEALRAYFIDQLASDVGATAIVGLDGTARVVIDGLSVVNGTSSTPLTLAANGTITGPSGLPVAAGGKIGGSQIGRASCRERVFSSV